jgi:hypothetical protein
MPAFLVVRAVIAEPALRAGFNEWYASDHLPWAIRALGAQRGWRLRSEADPSLHYAAYQFDDAAEIETALKSQAFQEVVADFDRRWPSAVTRTREIVTVIQEMVPM